MFVRCAGLLFSLFAVVFISGCARSELGAIGSPAMQNPQSAKSRPSSDVWSMYQAGPSHNAVFPRHYLDASWVVQFREKINAAPAIQDDVLYTDSFDHNVYAMDLRTGRLLWVTSTDNVVMSTPVVKDDIVVVGTGHDGWMNPNATGPKIQMWGRREGDNVYALSAEDGHVLWKYHTMGDDMASAAIGGDTVVFANGDLHAYGLDLHSGKLRWTTSLSGVASMDSTTIDHGVAFIGTCRVAPHRCETDALDVGSGKIRWRVDIGSADASPAVADGIVVVNMLDLDESGKFDQGGRSVISGIDEANGSTLWKWMSASGPCTFVGSGEHEIAPMINGGLVIDAIGCGSDVVALDLHSGKARWTLHASAHVKMSAVAYDGHVYLGDTNGVLYDVNERTGVPYRYVSFDQMFTTAPFVIAGRTLIATCNSEIYAFPLDRHVSPLDIPLHDVMMDNPFRTAAK